MDERHRRRGGESGLTGDEERLYRRYAGPLRASVGRRLAAPEATVEDACAHAWAQLVRAQPERRETIYGWLCRTAIHEGYRLVRLERREARLEDLVPEGAPFGWEDFVAAPVASEQREDARAALEVLAALPEKQRRYLALRVGGYSYREIAVMCGASYTNVNKHLTRARARVLGSFVTAQPP